VLWTVFVQPSTWCGDPKLTSRGNVADNYTQIVFQHIAAAIRACSYAHLRLLIKVSACPIS
jgi:hypothetical protein